ncbi:putative importin 13 [Talaromyces proteolyticus]|uniref:Importin 13 n=1 Tax=Talaromyces proteolyticus TaxID=1131652 RepID=A0AAD4L1F9_9EURO|nr:putative importin 13 [Talaromyces proteolyticus]KAH8702371.1 putative importin 13 [Talaromyces proteolyticus]
MDAAGQATALGSAQDPQALLEHAKTVSALLGRANILVSQLYNPSGTTPEQLKFIQERLQEIQRLPQGWQVAEGLLDHPDSNTRFFGALTFIVKINQSWSDLPDGTPQQLKNHLITGFVALVDAREKYHVIRKLAAALVALFFKDASWAHPLRDLGVAFKTRAVNDSSNVDFENTTLPSLNEAQITGLLCFSTAIAEEATKASSLVRESGDHPVAESIQDAFCLFDYVLKVLLQQISAGNATDTEAGHEALRSWHAWLDVRASIHFRTPLDQRHLSSPTNRLVQCIGIAELSETATEIIAEMLRSESSLLTDAHRQYILEYMSGKSAAELVQRLNEGDYDNEAMAFWDLLDAYTSTQQVKLVSGTLGPSHAVILSYFDRLFHGPGYPGVDDKISPLLLDWWTATADDLQYGVDNGLQEARLCLANSVLNVYNRLRWPMPGESAHWDADERSEFHSFRRETQDFLLSAFPTLGIELIDLFRQKAVAALSTSDWTELETACFCLAQLSEAIDGDNEAVAHLDAIFNSERFTVLCMNSEQLPNKPRQTLVDILGKYQMFFEQKPNLLPPVLTFLFSSLNISSCTNSASRSIGSLSKSCRHKLVAELPVFLRIFSEFQLSTIATAQSLERVVEGIAAIVQALPSEETKVPYIDELLRPFFVQSASARDDAQRGDVESAHTRGHLALRCIAGIGRGLRSDQDSVIDLESEETASYDNTFWTGHGIQEKLCQCLLVYLNEFPLDHVIVEDVCEVLKAGFTESIGPFVLKPANIALFLTGIPLGTAGAADVMMSTASSFLASYQKTPAKVQEEAALLFIHVYWAFSVMIHHPENNDPEVSNSGIAFLTRSLPKYHEILFALTSTPPPPASHIATLLDTQTYTPILQTILNFVTTALGGKEPLPLRSAAQFWVGVLNLSNSTNTHTNASRAIHEYLPNLCHVLVTQVSGVCARSDINHLCEVLKKIVFKFQGEARPHLSASLASIPGPNDQSASNGIALSLSKEKERFLAMLIGARGGSATQEVVRSYWVSCRGAGFAYT